MTKFVEQRSTRRRASKHIVVLYHAKCTDGFVAAWAAYRVLGLKAEYIPVEHQTPLPEGLTGKTVYLLDFSYPAEMMQKLVAENVRVIALDHHVTSRESTELAHDFRYSQEQSGAMLAWEYFHPNVPPPYLVRVVQDIDLHTMALPDALVLSDWLDLYNFDFRLYSKFARMLDTVAGRRRAVRTGEVVHSYRTVLVQRIISNNAYEVELDGYQVPAVTTELFHAEVAMAVAQGRPFGIAWRVRSHGVHVSLRSDEQGIDVGELAARHGGGGHKHIASFLVPTVGDLPFHELSSSSRL